MGDQGSGVKYDAFLSYSHSADQLLAQELQHALQQFGKRFYEIRALNIFRDQTDLSVNPALWPRIQAALDEAKFFLLLASPRAAKSTWVKREIDHWLSWHGGKPENLLILWTEGNLVWDPQKKDFDWSVSDALPAVLDWDLDNKEPRRLAGAFQEVPFYLDLRWTRTEEDLSLRHPQFLDHVATIAAELHSKKKRDLIGRDVTEHKRLKRLGAALAAALVVLSAAAIGFGVRAKNQQAEAERQAGIALERQHQAEAATATAVSRQLAAQSMETGESQDLSLLLALAARETADTQEASAALFQGLQRAGSLWSFLGATPNRLFSAVAFSPDGARAIAGNTDGMLFSFDPASGRAAGDPVAAHEGSIDAMAVDRTRSWLFTAGRDQKIGIRQLPSLNLIGVLPAPALSIPALDVSRDGVWLAAGAADVRLLNIQDRTWSEPFALRSGHSVRTLAFHPDSGMLAIGYDDGEIVLWDRATNAPLRSMRGHDTPYMRQTGSTLETRTDASVDSLAFSLDGNRLASGGYDGRVVIWDWRTGANIASTAPRAPSPVATVTFSADGSMIYAGTSAGELQAWRAETGSRAQEAVTAHQSRIVDSAAAEGSRLATVGWDGLLLLWDFDQWSIGKHFSPPEVVRAEENVQQTLVRHIEMLGGSKAVTSSAMQPLVLWDLEDPRRSRALPVAGGVEVFTVAGTRIAYVDERSRVMLLDSHSPNAAPVLLADLGSTGPIGELRARRGSDSLLAVATYGPLFEIALTGGNVARLEIALVAHPDGVVLSADGRRVASWNDEEFLVSDVSTRKELLRRKVRSSNLAFSSDGSLVAVNRYQFTDVWDLKSGVLRYTLDHVDRATPVSLMFSPDDRFLVATSSRPTFWDMATGFQVLQFRNPVARSKGTQNFSADSKRFVEGHTDGSVSVWDIDPESWRRTACRIANRSLTDAERTRYGVPARAAHVCR